jgi:hypothetical protein
MAAQAMNQLPRRHRIQEMDLQRRYESDTAIQYEQSDVK